MYPQTKSFRPARKNSGSPWRNAKPPEATTSNQSCEWAIRDAARAPATSKWTPRPAHRLARTCGSCAANEARGAALPWDSRQSATSQNADQRSRMGHREIQTVDRKSTRLNSSHANISYAVFCLKKKKKTQ